MNPKVLFISHCLEATGWGQAGRDWLLALDAVGVDVACRPVLVGQPSPTIPERVKQLIAKPSAGCIHVVQHLLPHHLRYDGRFEKNVAIFVAETSNFRQTAWAERLNLMDEVWVPDPVTEAACKASFVKKVVRRIPHAVDVGMFERSHQPTALLRSYKQRGEFLFYTVGEFTRRKNLAALLKAFHLEFDAREPVRLLVKTSKQETSPQECQKEVEDFCAKMALGLKLPPMENKVVVLTERVNEESLLRLHAQCDCFVSSSYGESACLPAMTAMGLGKTPVVTRGCGWEEYLSDKEGWLVDSREEPCFGAGDTFGDLYTGRETWRSIDVLALQKAMREAYSSGGTRRLKAQNGVRRIYDFSHEKVGQRMREALVDVQALAGSTGGGT